jgi:hypothetical protein
LHLGNESLQTFKLRARAVLQTSSDYEGEFFYILTEVNKIYKVPTIHVFSLSEKVVERTLVIELPDYNYVSSIYAYFNFLVVAMEGKLVTFSRESPTRFLPVKETPIDEFDELSERQG